MDNRSEKYAGYCYDSGTSEHVVMDSGYLSDVRRIVPVDIKLANRTTMTATKVGIAKICVSGKIILKCNANIMLEIKLNLLPCTCLEDYGITFMFRLEMCRLLDRENGDRVIRTLHKRQHDGLFSGRVIVPVKSKLSFTKQVNDRVAQNKREKCSSCAVEL